ncbi:hypothetical protein BC937DRAFT_87250 [Endogone sp. FLAS-F59071]|nr:hypothetical protein BC937DRAFT_87250 [Endogone sp. FLAS-F59071]|eukprot:RUS22753.1 hypothetical protein BC937DRAFT_87250 [Endogone sp. FLAS-F59071]
MATEAQLPQQQEQQPHPQLQPQPQPRQQNIFASLATRATQISAPASRTLLTSVSNLGQTLQQNARQFPGTVTTLSQTLGQRARELPSEIVNLPNRLEKERTDFIKQKSAEERGPKAGSEPVAPWVGFEQFEEELKIRITGLSTDKRNFLINPPADTGFQFDLAIYQRTAMAALRADPKLEHMRFVLVPREVNEPTFWKNYFYRVSLIKQSVLNAEKIDDGSVFEGSDEKPTEVLFDATTGDEDPAGWIDRELDDKEKTVVVEEKAAAFVVAGAPEGEIEDWEMQMRMALVESGEA